MGGLAQGFWGGLGEVFWGLLGGFGLSWGGFGGAGVVLANLGESRDDLGRVLGQSWGGLQKVLGRLGGVLGSDLESSWGILGPLGGILGHLGDMSVPFLLGSHFVTDSSWIL